MIPATLPLVEAMQYAKPETERVPADVFQNTLETPMWHAGLSVWSTLIAPPTKHARDTNALTLALEPAGSMQSALS